jgi:hypothetical protein
MALKFVGFDRSLRSSYPKFFAAVCEVALRPVGALAWVVVLDQLPGHASGESAFNCSGGRGRFSFLDQFCVCPYVPTRKTEHFTRGDLPRQVRGGGSDRCVFHFGGLPRGVFELEQV